MTLFDNYEIRQLENLDLLAQQVVEGFIIGLHKSPFHGFSVEFAEHRLYNQGESTRNMDWKVYARTDKMFTKKYEEETNLRCQILIDVSGSMYFPDPAQPATNKLGFSALAAASLMRLLSKQRDAFGLTLFDSKIHTHTRAKSGTMHNRLLLSFLEQFLTRKDFLNQKSNVVDTIHEIAESIHKRSLVCIFSDMFDQSGDNEALFSALQHLKHNKHEVILFHVTDRSKEQLFDYENRPTLFVDMETGEKIRLQPHQIKAFYTEQVEKFTKQLREKCLQYRIELVEADISKGFNAILQAYLVKRNRMGV